MINNRLKTLLEKEHIRYEVIPHTEKFTAQEIAGVEHISGKEIAKVVMVKAKGKNVMVVIPANRKLDLFKLSTHLSTKDLHVEDEKEFRDLFPECEIGAMPPIGELYHIPCYVDKSLMEEPELVFNGGNHRESVKLSTTDYKRVAHAQFGDFAVGF